MRNDGAFVNILKEVADKDLPKEEKKLKVGFVGFGNMARAMAGGMMKKGGYAKEDIIVSALHQETLENARKGMGVCIAENNREVVKASEVIFLAVKPQYYEEVITEIKGEVSEPKIVVSLAPGKSLAWLEEKFEQKIKLIRTMPNTPALVGEGMTGVCANDSLTKEEMRTVLPLFQSFGRVEEVNETLMDAVVGISGSSPAYVFVFVEAMADAAVKAGMSRKLAYEFAAQAVLGSAKMVLETGKHPAELKDMVCSPAGTTIEAVAALENGGFRAAVIEAVRVCVEKSRTM